MRHEVEQHSIEAAALCNDDVTFFMSPHQPGWVDGRGDLSDSPSLGVLHPFCHAGCMDEVQSSSLKAARLQLVLLDSAHGWQAGLSS